MTVTVYRGRMAGVAASLDELIGVFDLEGPRAVQVTPYLRTGDLIGLSVADQAAANHLGYVTRKLFLQGTPEEVEREARSLNDGGSILDRLKSQTTALRRRVSAADQRKLDAYFDAVRAAEQELTEVQAWFDLPKPVVGEEPPTDIPDPADLIGRIRLLFRMIPLILETDSSRVVSMMLHDHGSVPQVQGVSVDPHNLSHHGQDETKIAQLKRIETEVVRACGDLLTDLQGRSSTSCTRESTTHRSATCSTMLQNMGVETDSFGQSTETLTWS